MALQLRDYQVDMYEEAKGKLLAGAKSILIQSPTGSGKTVLVAKIMQTVTSKGKRAWFNVHRRELVKQSVRTLTESAGLDIGVVAAGFQGNRHRDAQVCSVSTLMRRVHLMPSPNMLLWDEAHHCASKSWSDLIEKFPSAVHLGMTATPERLDGTGLGNWYQHMITGPSVKHLIANGHLSPYRLFTPKAPDLTGVHTLGGEFNKKELNEVMSKSAVVGDAVSHYRKHALGKRAIAFAWSIESSIDLAEKFKKAGIPAEHVDGKTDEATRDAAMKRFIAGKTLVLTNVDLFSEGVDVPALEAVIMLRPTQSLAMYLQQVGRALRLFPGKKEALIFDHAGNVEKHGLPDDDRVWTLEGRRGKPRDSDAMPVRQCPMCFRTVSAGADKCKHCGYKFEAKPREVEVIDGELHEVDLELVRREKYQEQVDAKSLDSLIALGKARGYKSPEKWANHIHKARLAKRAGEDAREWLTRTA